MVPYLVDYLLIIYHVVFLHTDLEAWSVAHLSVQIGKIEYNATEPEIVYEFKQLIFNLFNMGTGNMLKEGNILTWNVWFTAPELVNQTEWKNHAECWRDSIDVDNTSPDGPGTIKRYYDGSPFKSLKEFEKEEEKLVVAFLKKHNLWMILALFETIG